MLSLLIFVNEESIVITDTRYMYLQTYFLDLQEHADEILSTLCYLQ
jgi:hypothetical protein